MPTGIYKHQKPSEETKRKMSLAKKGKMPKHIPPPKFGKNNNMWKGDKVAYSTIHD